MIHNCLCLFKVFFHSTIMHRQHGSSPSTRSIFWSIIWVGGRGDLPREYKRPFIQPPTRHEETNSLLVGSIPHPRQKYEVLCVPGCDSCRNYGTICEQLVTSFSELLETMDGP